MTDKLATVEIDPQRLLTACETYLEVRESLRSSEVEGLVDAYLERNPTSGILWWKRKTTKEEAIRHISDYYIPSYGMYNKIEVEMLLSSAKLAIQQSTKVTVTAQAVAILKGYL